MATWPRRIVALSVSVALLVGLASGVAVARDVLVHDGDGSANSGGPYSRFALASGTTLKYTTQTNGGFIPHRVDVLAPYACVMLSLNTQPIDVFRKAALKGYMEGGGTVVAVGEYGTFSGGSPDNVMNDVAASVGSTMAFVNNVVDFGPASTTNIGTHALTTFPGSVASIGYNATTTMTLGATGQSLARASNGQPFIGVSQIGSGRFVMVGDSNALIDDPDQYTPYDNDVWVRNMCGNINPPNVTIVNPVPTARYKLNQQNAATIANYFCTDPDDRVNPFYSDVVSCSGPVAVGAHVDTSVPGSHPFTVTAVDAGGNTDSETVNYVVDDDPPDITITTPADGSNVPRRSTLVADFACTDPDNDVVQSSIVGTVPNGTVIDTTGPAGARSFTVTCQDTVGNVATKTVNYTIVDESPPDITVTMPNQDGTTRLRLNQQIGANFVCTDEDGPADIAFCTGTVGFGAPVPTGVAGPQIFTVNAADLAGNPAQKNVPYVVDPSPPAITITVPADNGRYNKGTQLLADYGCSDPDDTTDPEFKDVALCAGPVANGDTIDTSAAGVKTFKVDAADRAGNTATKTHTYTILGTAPPAVTIASPVDGAVFKRGAAIPVSYSCSDPDGPSDIKSCTRDGSGPLDSSKVGTFRVTARAVDFADNVATKTHSYTVTADPVPAQGTAPKTSTPAKVCKSRRSFTVRVKKKKGVRIVSATVTVNGKRQKAKKGKRFTGKVVLIGLKKGRYRVVIKAKLSNGKTATDIRRFKTCTPKGK
jgi:hypothetical protein